MTPLTPKHAYPRSLRRNFLIIQLKRSQANHPPLRLACENCRDGSVLFPSYLTPARLYHGVYTGSAIHSHIIIVDTPFFALLWFASKRLRRPRNNVFTLRPLVVLGPFSGIIRCDVGSSPLIRNCRSDRRRRDKRANPLRSKDGTLISTRLDLTTGIYNSTSLSHHR